MMMNLALLSIALSTHQGAHIKTNFPVHIVSVSDQAVFKMKREVYSKSGMNFEAELYGVQFSSNPTFKRKALVRLKQLCTGKPGFLEIREAKREPVKGMISIYLSNGSSVWVQELLITEGIIKIDPNAPWMESLVPFQKAAQNKRIGIWKPGPSIN